MSNPMKNMPTELRRSIAHDALVQLGWKFYQRDGKWWCFAKIESFERECPEGVDSQEEEVIDMAVALAMHAIQHEPVFAMKFLATTARMVMAHRDDLRAAYEQQEQQPAAIEPDAPEGPPVPGSKLYLKGLLEKYGPQPIRGQ